MLWSTIAFLLEQRMTHPGHASAKLIRWGLVFITLPWYFATIFFTRFTHSAEYKVINKTLPDTSQIGLTGPCVRQLCAPGLLHIKFALEFRKGKAWSPAEEWLVGCCFCRPTASRQKLRRVSLVCWMTFSPLLFRHSAHWNTFSFLGSKWDKSWVSPQNSF